MARRIWLTARREGCGRMGAAGCATSVHIPEWASARNLYRPNGLPQMRIKCGVDRAGLGGCLRSLAPHIVSGVEPKPSPTRYLCRNKSKGATWHNPALQSSFRPRGKAQRFCPHRWLPDAINDDAVRLSLAAFWFSGRRFDCNWLDGLLTATIARQAQLGRTEIKAMIAHATTAIRPRLNLPKTQNVQARAAVKPEPPSEMSL